VQYSGELRLWFGNPGVNGGAAPASAFTAGAWHAIVIVYDKDLTGNANRLKMWVNGTQQTLNFFGTIPASIVATSDTLAIGAFNNGTQPLNGAFRAIGQWASAATAAEVAEITSYMSAM
jgi:hypothetical protein